MRCYRKYCAPCREALASMNLVTPNAKRQRMEEPSTPTKEPMSGSEDSDDSYLADTRQKPGVCGCGKIWMAVHAVPCYPNKCLLGDDIKF